MKMKLVYFSYPYSSNPRQRTKEVAKLVHKILKKHQSFVPIVPHFVFDALFGFPSEGYKKAFYAIGPMEYEIISRCDLFVYSPNHLSAGVYWELCFARWKGIPIKTCGELGC